MNDWDLDTLYVLARDYERDIILAGYGGIGQSPIFDRVAANHFALTGPLSRLPMIRA